MTYSDAERTAHAQRRLGMGPVGWAGSPDDAIQQALQPLAPVPQPPEIEAPSDEGDATDLERVVPGLVWWLQRMAAGERPLEERLAWFWHDHFALHVRKVRFPYLAWQNHLTIRSHATGNFAELLMAVSTDPAMLVYLDSVRSTAENPNENFARELMELHTLGTGNYSQVDVTEAARAMTGWVVKLPFARRNGFERFDDAPDWSAVFIPPRWDSGTKTLLGRSGALDMTDVVELLLGQPVTAAFIAAKLYRELVGLEPPADELDRLAAAFRSQYDILALVEAIVDSPAFLSDAAIRAKVRNPLEKLATVAAAFGATPDRRVIELLDINGYIPFTAPNPAGYPDGEILLGPHRTIHTLDLGVLAPAGVDGSAVELLSALGINDVSSTTRTVIDQAGDPAQRVALAIASPEFALI